MEKWRILLAELWSIRVRLCEKQLSCAASVGMELVPKPATLLEMSSDCAQCEVTSDWSVNDPNFVAAASCCGCPFPADLVSAHLVQLDPTKSHVICSVSLVTDPTSLLTGPAVPVLCADVSKGLGSAVADLKESFLVTMKYHCSAALAGSLPLLVHPVCALDQGACRVQDQRAPTRREKVV